MSLRFFTNSEKNTLLAKLEGVLKHNSDIARFDALVGYLRASGYFALRPHLQNVPEIRILVGIDVDEIVSDYHKKGLLFLADPAKAMEDFQQRLKSDIQHADYRPEIEQGITQFVNDVVSGKLVLRAHPTKRLHAKIYIFLPKGFCEHKPGAVITGSSNLTAAGLGAEEQSRNYEFNVLLHDYSDVKFASDEFDKLWEESVPILPKTVMGVRDSTYLGAKLTPHEMYFKMLAEYFGADVDYDPNSALDLPAGFKRLSYQSDAVKSGYRLLEKHNGFFLSDVVGLGKTVIATLIAKKFFFGNGFPDHISSTLIITPPALLESWKETVEKFRLKGIEFETNGSLHKRKSVEKFDLIIVDEAHKFRNDTADGFKELQRICKTGTHRRLPDGTMAPKKVILISATPLNNAPADLRNLISLFQDPKHSSLAVGNLQHFFAQREKEFREAKFEPNLEKARRRVVAIYEQIRTKVISEITVRRTRTDLMENEEYRKDLETQGVFFPAIAKPRHILYPLSPDLEQLFDETVYMLSAPGDEGLTYNRYRAIAHLTPDLKLRYANADKISGQLATLMRTLLVKRLDSSFTAFTASLRRFHDATRVMIDMFERGAVYIAPKLPVTDLLLDGREEELLALIEARQESDPGITVCQPGDFNDDLLKGLRADLAKLSPILKRWSAVVSSGNDPKLEKFLELVRSLLNDRELNREGKLVIFSESRETTAYLTSQLERENFRKLLAVDSSNRDALREEVRANFDANFSGKREHKYQILIATEVLAEGVNLHRSNIILNYDTPWNSTRLMQRIGRVNRIGSVAPVVYTYNFYPTARVDDDIELRKKAIMKLQAFHSALGEDSQIYSTDEEVDSFGLFEKNPEDGGRDERLALLMELRRFRDENPDAYRRLVKMPPRCRVGRADSARAGGTVAFVRNHRRNAFYRLSPDGTPEEIAFTEAAREFRALDPAERGIALHGDHHSHLNTAVAAFAGLIVAEASSPRTVEVRQGPNEKRALAYLEAFLAFDFLSDDERKKIRLAKTAVHRARFQHLQRDINKLKKDAEKSKSPPAVLTDRLFEILRQYPLADMDAQAGNSPAVSADLAVEDTAPDIILSESFDHSASA